MGAAGIAMQGAEQLFRSAGIETEAAADVEVVGMSDCRTKSCQRELWPSGCGALK